MATPKTECSELSIGLGLLGFSNPFEISYAEIVSKFEGSLTEVKFNSFISTYPSDGIYASMNNAGIRLRNDYPRFSIKTAFDGLVEIVKQER